MKNSSFSSVRRGVNYAYDSAGNITGLVVGYGATYDIRHQAQIPGGIWCDWQSGTGTLAMVSTDAGDDVALDTAVTLDGYAAAKCTFSNAASGTFIAEFTFTNAVSLKNFKTIQVPIRITGNDSTGGVISNTAPFQVWLYLSGGGTVRLQCDGANHPPGMWHVYSFSRESPSGMVTFASGATAWTDLDSQTISKVRIVQASIAASVGYPIWVGPMRVNARAVGTLSIVLDGCYASQYSLIKPILDRYGIKTSLAIVNSFIGSSASYMTLAQIDQMYDEGHECVHHTYDGTKQNGYLNATDWTSAAAISDDINQQWAYFRTQGWHRGIGFAVDGFSNPFAKTVSASRQALLKAAFSMAGVRCSRASVGLYTTQMPLGYHGVRPYFLRGAIQVTSTDTAAAMKTIIDQAEANGEWAIFTLHRAVESGAGSLETTTTILDEVCAYAAARVAAGNFMVEPMGQAYNRHFAD